jgi:hypothetical protein
MIIIIFFLYVTFRLLLVVSYEGPNAQKSRTHFFIERAPFRAGRAFFEVVGAHFLDEVTQFFEW